MEAESGSNPRPNLLMNQKILSTSPWLGLVGIKGDLGDHLLRTSRDNSPVATFIK